MTEALKSSYQGSEEPWLGVELLRGVSDAASQDPPQDVAATGVVGPAAIAQGNGQGPDVVGHDSAKEKSNAKHNLKTFLQNWLATRQN